MILCKPISGLIKKLCVSVKQTYYLRIKCDRMRNVLILFFFFSFAQSTWVYLYSIHMTKNFTTSNSNKIQLSIAQRRLFQKIKPCLKQKFLHKLVQTTFQFKNFRHFKPSPSKKIEILYLAIVENTIAKIQIWENLLKMQNAQA